MSQIIKTALKNSILHYNQQNMHKIVDICDPLNKYFGITHFCYLRVFNDGRYILISNNQFVLDLMVCNDYFFRTEQASNVPQYLFKKEINRQLWPDNAKDEAIERLQVNEIYNGFNIIREREGTLEGYLFATGKDHPLIKGFYKNNFSTLEEFIVYFHKIGRDLCDPSDITKQGISPYLRKTYPYIENIFEATNPWEKDNLEFNLLLNSKIQGEIAETAKRNSLSSRELQCLSHSSTGMTAKEIARTLGIGYRTIETYLDNIRLKTGCQTKRELIHWFEDKFKYLLTTQE